ncbi:MAG: acetate kinase [Desulfocapsaceae bacterium]
MKTLVINSGSSSIKFQLLEMKGEQVLASGLVERIGDEQGKISCLMRPGSSAQCTIEIETEIADHQQGMEMVGDVLCDKRKGVVGSSQEIGVVGHRVVHGGEAFHQPIIIDDTVVAAIEQNIPLAPLHNPANLDGIRVARKLFPGIVQVAVFDTAFHQTIPKWAHIYALPYELYKRHRVRRYGFHGTSHKFVAGECARLMGRQASETNLITIHLGNGCSMSAVENGCSIDTSLGMTPLEGLVMGTRSGDVDPAIHSFLQRTAGLDLDQIDGMLNKDSGLKGICGLNDMRDIHAAADAGDELASLALEVQTYRNKKYIWAYMAVLGRVDALVFTAGIGENDPIVREKSLSGLEHLGIQLDVEKNRQRFREAVSLHAEKSRVQVWVIPTNEELAIARESICVVEDAKSLQDVKQ